MSLVRQYLALTSENFSLLLFGDDEMPFRLEPGIKSFDFIFLILLVILVCKECFLADEAYLFLSPDVHTVAPLVLNFFLQLNNCIFEIVFVVLALLSALQEELTL